MHLSMFCPTSPCKKMRGKTRDYAKILSPISPANTKLLFNLIDIALSLSKADNLDAETFNRENC